MPAFRKMLRTTRLPLPLRRLFWAIGLNFGRQRANYFGSFGVTSVAAYGAGQLHALSPGPFVLSYGVEKPDQTIDVVLRWDHRITDAALMAKVLNRLEQVLNTEICRRIAGQSAANRAKTGPGGRDLTALGRHSGAHRRCEPGIEFSGAPERPIVRRCRDAPE